MKTFEPRVLPCEGCGELVEVLATDELAKDWATGVLAVFCPDCWKHDARSVSLPEPPKGRNE